MTLPPPLPPGEYKQEPFLLRIHWDEKQGTTATIMYKDTPIFFGHSALEVADLRRELEKAREARYFWKGVALHLGYSGPRPYYPFNEKLTIRSRMKNYLFQLIHTKEKN